MKISSIFLLLSMFLSIVTPETAFGLSYATNKISNTLIAVGAFELNDEKGFRAALDRNPNIEEVWFDSPGGNVSAALKIGRLLRERGIATRIPKGASCESACPYAFVGGVIRSADPGTKVGVHMATRTNDDALINDITILILKYGPAAARHIATLFEQGAAKGANHLARYLMEMRVSLDLMTIAIDTESTGMRYLSRAELIRYNVVNN
jgi:hypothetical protein